MISTFFSKIGILVDIILRTLDSPFLLFQNGPLTNVNVIFTFYDITPSPITRIKPF